MKTWLLILGAAITLFNLAVPITAKRKVVCYHGSWSVYRPGDGKFEIEYIDPNLCTHVIYTFVGIEYNGGIRILDSWNEIDKGGFRRFNDLKKRNPSLKTSVAIGGWNEGSSTYSSVVNDATRRAAFVKNIVDFVKQYEFDGFDLDWEYPAQRGGAATDKAAFILLLKELRVKFDEHGLLLSAAVASAESSASLSYNILEVGKYLDFINVMTYDLHGSWDPVTGHSAPLYGGPNDGLTVDAAIQYWITQGAPREKIILGIGTYGRSFTLSSASQCSIGAPTIGAGSAGPYTREAGALGYNEICERVSTWNVKWDDQQKVPYACNGNQWVGYDDIRSTTHKAEYVVQHDLGGAMIWSVETDDFLGKCHGVKYPLLKAINDVLFGDVPPSKNQSTSESQPATTTAKATTTTSKATTSKSTTTTTAAITTTAAAPPAGQDSTSPTQPPDAPTDSGSSDPPKLCTEEGYVRDPNDKRIFYQCHKFSGDFTAFRFECALGLVFDISINVCNWASAVKD